MAWDDQYSIHNNRYQCTVSCQCMDRLGSSYRKQHQLHHVFISSLFCCTFVRLKIGITKQIQLDQPQWLQFTITSALSSSSMRSFCDSPLWQTRITFTLGKKHQHPFCVCQTIHNTQTHKRLHTWRKKSHTYGLMMALMCVRVCVIHFPCAPIDLLEWHSFQK